MTDQLPATQVRERPAPMQTGGVVGALVPQTLEEGFRLASAMAASGMTPRDIDTPEKVLVAIMAGAELGMKPFQAVQSFAIVNGRPSLWGDGLMALALTNGLDIDEWLEGEGDQMRAFCRVTRPDNGKVVTRDYGVDDAKTAKLWGKVSASGKPSPWVTQPKRMLQMRARSFAIRDAAADVLRGMPIKEEIEDFIEANPGIMDRPDPAQRGTGLLAKLQTTETLATEGFGIRDVATEAGEAEPAPEPKPKRARKATVANAALDAIAEAEPEIVAQVVEDHGSDVQSLVKEMSADVRRIEADFRAADAEVETDTQREATADYEAHLTATAAIEGPAPADTVYFMADDETFPSGRRPVWFNGVANGVVEGGEDYPTYTEHAPAKADRPKSAPAAEAPAEPTTESPSPSPSDESTSPSNTASPNGGATTASPSDGVGSADATDGPFAVFDEQARNAKDWPELSRALTELSRAPEWKTDAEAKRGARIKAWAIVSRWNEDGAKLDPASSPNLLQIAVTAWDDPEMIQGLYATAQGMPWLAEAEEAMQSSVSRFILDRLAEIRGA